MKPKNKLEKTFQARVQRQLKTLPNTWFFKAAERARVGIPDIIACVNGQFVGLELKRSDKEHASPIQAYTLNMIQAAGGYSKVVATETWNEVWEYLQRLANDKGKK